MNKQFVGSISGRITFCLCIFSSNLVNKQTYFRCLLNSYFNYIYIYIIFLKSWRPWTNFQNPLQKLVQRTFLDCRTPTPYPTIPENWFVKHAWWVDAYIMVTSHIFSPQKNSNLDGPNPRGPRGDRSRRMTRRSTRDSWPYRPVSTRQGFRRLNQQHRWELMGIMRFHGPEGFCGIWWAYTPSGNSTLLWKMARKNRWFSVWTWFYIARA